MRQLERLLGLGLMIFATVGIIGLLAVMARMGNEAAQAATHTPTFTATPDASATATFPPTTPLPTLTASRTLLPPPTFEPPTLTPLPSNTPTITPTATLRFSVDVPGINGLESPTPTSTAGCEVRKDWKLTYEVKAFDTLEQIANKYGTFTSDLAAGNCLTDANVITIGQVLHVPGDVQPATPGIECVPWEMLTPINHASNVDGNGQLTFNWRGPRAPRNLIRVFKPDGTLWERTIDLRQNETINLAEELPAEGVYSWQVYPLDLNFVQISCKESPVWTFQKTAADRQAKVN